MKQHIVVVLSGWVFCGETRVDQGMVCIENCYNIRVWGTTAGLGELALNGCTERTKLDYVGVMKVPLRNVLALIECEAELKL